MLQPCLTSVSPSKTSQNVYSAQSCNTVTESQIEPVFKVHVCETTLPVEQRQIQAPFHAGENTAIASGTDMCSLSGGAGNDMTEEELSEDTPLLATPEKKPISRSELMLMSSHLIRILHRKTTSHRFKPAQHDSTRLQYARATIAAITAYGSLLHDDLTELEERIETLEGRRQ